MFQLADSQDVFISGSFTEHWAVPPSKQRGKAKTRTTFVFAFAVASCEAHFMMFGELMHLSCLWLRL